MAEIGQNPHRAALFGLLRHLQTPATQQKQTLGGNTLAQNLITHR